MTSKPSSKLLLFSLFGIALWFFGNLYEGIVIAPNLLEDSIRKVRDWQDFFALTNPIFFYIPIAPIAVLTMVLSYFKTSDDSIVLKRHLKLATVFGLLAFALGIFIITQINLKLFFGDLDKYSSEVHKLAVLWNILNVIRVALLAVALYHLFKAYIFMQSEEEK
jgi:hypothetical protein